jgi:hypothetical protein
MKTKHEKDATKIAKAVINALGEPLTELIKSYGIDTTAMIAFWTLSETLRKKRTEINADFKAFCKSYGFRQYKIKEIEGNRIANADKATLAKYAKVINAENELKEWVSKFPTIAKKYNIIQI